MDTKRATLISSSHAINDCLLLITDVLKLLDKWILLKPTPQGLVLVFIMSSQKELLQIEKDLKLVAFQIRTAVRPRLIDVILSGHHSDNNHLDIIIRLLMKSRTSLGEIIQVFVKLDESTLYYLLTRPLTKIFDRMEEAINLLDEANLLTRTNLPELRHENWDFINNATTRAIVIRDYSELVVLSQSKALKSFIIICGSIMETLLLDFLTTRSRQAKSKYKKLFPKSTKAINEWMLYEYIVVMNELGFLDNETRKHADLIREYRNIVHPAVEIRDSIKIDDELTKVISLLFSRIVRRLRELNISSPSAK